MFRIAAKQGGIGYQMEKIGIRPEFGFDQLSAADHGQSVRQLWNPSNCYDF